jgi:hypothetical protein
MIPGIAGHLLSHGYLEQQVLASPCDAGAVDAFARTLDRWWRRAAATLGPASSPRAVLDIAALPLFDVLGFSAAGVSPWPGGHFGTLNSSRRPQAPAIFLSVPWDAPPMASWREAVRASLASGARWALVTSGTRLVVVDARRAWAPRYLEFDLDVVRRHRSAAGVLHSLVSGAALDDGPRGRLDRAVRESDRLGVQVCRSLGGGVLDAVEALAAALDQRRRRDVAAAQVVEQALIIVYRLLFFLFAEARGLVPIWHEIYREAYSIDTLSRRLGERPDLPGVWATVQAISRLAHAGCRAGDLDVTAFNGRLFSPAHAPLAEYPHLSDGVVRRAVLALATTSSSDGMRPVAYQDLGVEQLGSVYERVLEYEPVRSRGSLTLQRTSLARKTSGSFYTPRTITDFLVRRTLAPLVDGCPADRILQLRIVDPAMGSGAFLVAACRYLADRLERALIDEGRWSAGDAGPADRAALRRRVAERCVFGVDLNPTAVQLARLSLWLSTLAADKPLTFLDHHLVCGDSLVGAGLRDLAMPFSRGGPATPLPLFEQDAAGVLARDVLPQRSRIALDPSDSADAVRRKERALAALTLDGGPLKRWKLAADLRCAALLDPHLAGSGALYADLQRHVLGDRTSLRAAQLDPLVDRAAGLAAARGCLHWDLTFPEVFFDGDGRERPDAGFDAVIGNPPWDMVRADSGDREARTAARGATAALLRFVRTSGGYARPGTGHVNRYQLFAERALQLVRPGGRLGMLLPSGVQTDVGSAPLRRALLDGCTVDTWLGFDNRDGIFPIHRSLRFIVFAATRGARTERLSYACGLRDPAVLDEQPDAARAAADAARVTLDRALLDRWDPDGLSIPEAGAPLDLAIIAQAMDAAPPLASEEGWGVRFGRELNATDHRKHFAGIPRNAASENPDVLPVLEGKHVEPFRVRTEAATLGIRRGSAARLIDPSLSYERPRIAYRDVAAAGNRLTLIAALLPEGALSTHTLFCQKTRLAARSQWCLLGLLNSLVANYLVRLQVTTHVTVSMMARLPVPRPAAGSAAFREIEALARRLSIDGIAGSPDAYARLNAVVAGLYGLTVDQYAHVVRTFPLLPDDLRARCVAGLTNRLEGRAQAGPWLGPR